MKIQFVGDVTTQAFNVLKKRLNLSDIVINHHIIDQHIPFLIGSSDADIIILHHNLSFFINGQDDPIAVMAEYCDRIRDFSKRHKSMIVMNNLVPNLERIVGTAHLDHLNMVALLNREIYNLAMELQWASVADIQSIVTKLGSDQAINKQNDFVMRMPYTRQAISAIIEEYSKIILEAMVPRKKLILLDADNTLWGGVVGEDGVHGIAIGSQYPAIVYENFQQQLCDIQKSGILLALVSKNNEADVKEAFDQINMPLKWDDFAAVRVNWQPKSDNIQSIAEELNLGLSAMVFIDDNPFEINQVNGALPDIDCYQFDGKNVKEALSLLYNVKGLNCWTLTDEDKDKQIQYKKERERTALKTSSQSLDDYIKSLQVKIEVGINRHAQLKRITQLTNKTNQFNLTTRRYSEPEIMAIMEIGMVFDFRVVDRFGDMGIVGVSIIADGEIEAFLMSCRALGRKIETSMLQYICQKVSDLQLKAQFIPSDKNAMVANFYDDNGFNLVNQANGIKYYQLAPISSNETLDNFIEVD